MNTKSRVFLAVCVSFVLLVLAVSSRAEEQKPQLYAIWEVVSGPDTFMGYEAAAKDMLAFYTKHEFPRPYSVYRTEDFHYLFLVPIENMAALDDLFSYFAKVDSGEDFENLKKKMMGTYESESIGVVLLKTDLSYAPENPRVKPEAMNFIWWSYFYFKPGMEKEAEEISKDWVTMHESHGIPDAYNIFWGVLWNDLPGLVVAGWAKSEADHYAHNAKNMEKMGDEYWALMKKTLSICRKFEMKTGYFLKDLSYMPAKKEAKE